MLSGDNGILQKATDAKEQTGIGQEKEIVALAYNSALAKKVGNGISTPVTSEDMNAELTNQGATASESNPIKVTFTDSKRQYTVDNGIVDYAGIKTDNPAGDGLEGLSSTEIALLPTGVTEKTIENISNENLKNITKIKAVITDSDNGEVPIPKGANYKDGTESTGVVIEYKGSEFVWIPVPVTISNLLYPKGTTKAMAKESTGDYAGTTHDLINYEGVFYSFSGTGNASYSEEQSNYGQNYIFEGIAKTQSEPDILSYTDNNDGATYITELGYSTVQNFGTELQSSYNLMIDSVKKYGGFYVGRYETSIDVTTGVASKYNVQPMNGRTASGNLWYGMYQKQKDFSGDETDTMQSSMIWGSQWDAMLNWILTGNDKAKVNASSNGNHGSLTNTGVTTTDVMNNIYDLEGNYADWTVEAQWSNARTSRGGLYDPDVTFSASIRNASNVSPTSQEWATSSRLSLYIK